MVTDLGGGGGGGGREDQGDEEEGGQVQTPKVEDGALNHKMIKTRKRPGKPMELE